MLTKMTRILWLAAGLSGAAAVALGAYGAHGAGLAETALDRFETALLYHFLHTLALAGAALLGTRRPSLPALAAGLLFLAGIALFSGTLYAAAVSDGATSTAAAPWGGIGFILGWLLLGFAGWRSVRSDSM